MFKFKRGIKADYFRQGYIYFTSLNYKNLTPEKQKEITNLCLKYGGEHHRALFEFVTGDTTATAVSVKHYISKATLYRAVKRYYENFTL